MGVVEDIGDEAGRHHQLGSCGGGRPRGLRLGGRLRGRLGDGAALDGELRNRLRLAAIGELKILLLEVAERRSSDLTDHHGYAHQVYARLEGGRFFASRNLAGLRLRSQRGDEQEKRPKAHDTPFRGKPGGADCSWRKRAAAGPLVRIITFSTLRPAWKLLAQWGHRTGGRVGQIGWGSESTRGSVFLWGGWRDSNPRPLEPQSRAMGRPEPRRVARHCKITELAAMPAATSRPAPGTFSGTPGTF